MPNPNESYTPAYFEEPDVVVELVVVGFTVALGVGVPAAIALSGNDCATKETSTAAQIEADRN
jgi:hypothetical protein